MKHISPDVHTAIHWMENDKICEEGDYIPWQIVWKQARKHKNVDSSKEDDSNRKR